MRRDRLLHLHRLQHHDRVSLDDAVAVRDGDLDDGALHRRGEAVATDGRAGVGLLLRSPLARFGGGARAQQSRRDAHLEALAADLDDEAGALLGDLADARGGVERFERVVPLGLDPAGVDGEVLGEGRVVEHGAVERQDRRHALDLHLGEGAPRALEGLGAGGAGDDDLGEQRVEVPVDDGALLDAGVDAHARAGGQLQFGDRAGGRQEAAPGVFAVDAELDGVAARLGVLGDVEGLAGGDAELLAHQVDAAGLLGDGVLDLEAGIHLEEGDGAVGADEELDGAGAVVVRLPADRLGGAVDRGALLVAEERRGGFFDELLVAALEGAVAGADDDHVAVGVGQDLRLDVTGAVEVALDEAFAAPERGLGLADGRVEQVRDLVALAGDLEAAPAAAEGGLDRDGEPVLVGEGEDLRGVRGRLLGAGHQRHVRTHGQMASGDLVAEVANRLRGRTDPGDPGVDDGLREFGVLREEAVARVDGVGLAALGDADELVDTQIGVGGTQAVEGEGLVRQERVWSVAIAVGVDGDGLEARITAGPDDSHRYFAAVGDQYLAHVPQCNAPVSEPDESEHRSLPRNSGKADDFC
ncbi:hypothetical protein GCM10028833_14950 [Glycomyces tarimensis]